MMHLMSSELLICNILASIVRRYWDILHSAQGLSVQGLNVHRLTIQGLTLQRLTDMTVHRAD